MHRRNHLPLFISHRHRVSLSRDQSQLGRSESLQIRKVKLGLRSSQAGPPRRSTLVNVCTGSNVRPSFVSGLHRQQRKWMQVVSCGTCSFIQSVSQSTNISRGHQVPGTISSPRAGVLRLSSLEITAAHFSVGIFVRFVLFCLWNKCLSEAY